MHPHTSLCIGRSILVRLLYRILTFLFLRSKNVYMDITNPINPRKAVSKPSAPVPQDVQEDLACG
jgi:hypothetical protein